MELGRKQELSGSVQVSAITNMDQPLREELGGNMLKAYIYSLLGLRYVDHRKLDIKCKTKMRFEEI